MKNIREEFSLDNDNHKSSLTHKIKFLSKALVGLSHVTEGIGFLKKLAYFV